MEEKEERVAKENRRKKVGKRRKQMRVHGAGLRRVTGIWKERADEIEKKRR